MKTPQKCDHKDSNEFRDILLNTIVKDGEQDTRVLMLRALSWGRRLHREEFEALSSRGFSPRTLNALAQFGVLDMGQLSALEPFLKHVANLGSLGQREAKLELARFRKEVGL